MVSHQHKTRAQTPSAQTTKSATTAPHVNSQPLQLNPYRIQPAQILKLQSIIGNHAVQRIFSPALMMPSVAHQARITGEVLGMVEEGNSRLPLVYVQDKLGAIASNAGLQSAYKQAIQDIIDSEPDQQEAVIMAHAGAILRQVERQFIQDDKASTLDLLPDGKGDKYRNFDWQDNDFPGDKATLKDGSPNPKKGKNEGLATRMAGALGDLFPEMRANSGDDGVVLEKEFDSSEALREFIKNQLVAVPDQGGKRLNSTASDAFVQMREAALEDGVDLTILAAYRKPEVSKKRAKETGNASAVADFSAHNLGLAMDLRMSTDDQKFKEISTKMTNVIKMRQSSIHKWLFLNADLYGWYPYHNEPWHWEYNPPGFREQFHEDAKSFWEARELGKK